MFTCIINVTLKPKRITSDAESESVRFAWPPLTFTAKTQPVLSRVWRAASSCVGMRRDPRANLTQDASAWLGDRRRIAF